MVVKKLLVGDKVTACVEQYVSWVLVSNRKTLSGETVCFSVKRLLSIFKFELWQLIVFLGAADWPTTNFLGMCSYFPVI